MRVHFVGRDEHRIRLCQESARLAGVESAVFSTFEDALNARPLDEALVLASDNVLLSRAPEAPLEEEIINPGNRRRPSHELTLIGPRAPLLAAPSTLEEINRFSATTNQDYRSDHLAAFLPNLPSDYDFTRFRRIPAFVTFSSVSPRDALRATAMSEMLELFQFRDYDFSGFVRKPIVEALSRGLRDGERMSPTIPGSFGVRRFVAVCDEGFQEDLWRLLPTVLGHHRDAEFHLYCDDSAARTAEEIAGQLRVPTANLHLQPVIDRESLSRVERRFKGVNQSSYWKPGAIWWKLESLRRVLEKSAEPTLLVDCDITFNAPVQESFRGVDVVMSPFFWPNPNLRVRLRPDSNKMVPIAERDGWFNAGYLLATRVEVPETWLELFEQSVGGFYEQYCMGFLPQRFRHDVFGSAHNWGQWRCEIPPPDVVSVHAHQRTKHTHAHGKAIQEIASRAARQFLQRDPVLA